jgi:hypothetical protein
MVDFYPTKNPFGFFEDLLLFVVAYLSVTPLKVRAHRYDVYVRAAGLLARCQKEKNNCRKLEAAVGLLSCNFEEDTTIKKPKPTLVQRESQDPQQCYHSKKKMADVWQPKPEN